MPHAAFHGQTPDEMYFGTAANLPAELAAARSKAWAERLAANRAMTCDRCTGQQASPPISQIPHDSRADAVAYMKLRKVLVRSNDIRGNAKATKYMVPMSSVP